jgi:DNA helicase-2/ATP-dependent DNA helicase PcrA
MLNKNQKKAVEYLDGYGFVSAIPGSGKTRVLTERTVRLIEKKVDPTRILCITFTNKAASEMRGRIKSKLDDDISSQIWISTFHSMGAKILRKEASSIPLYDENFTIIDHSDQMAILEKATDELGMQAKGRKNKSGVDLRDVLSAINSKKDKLQTNAEFAEDHDEVTCKLYNYYKDYLLKTNCMDFGDLLLILHKLLKKRKKVLDKYSRRFSYIMVDECQDLNYCQYEIVKMLASHHGNLVLIGDTDQSIYRFRQADPKHVFNYLKEKKVDHLPLSLNYRSTKRILKCAEAVIKNNSDRTSTKMDTENMIGNRVHMVRESSGYKEQDWVAETIGDLVDQKDYKYSDFAILYRVNSLSRGFEQAMRMKKIPCKIIGGTSFFDFEVVKLLTNREGLSLMRWLKELKNTVSNINAKSLMR